MKWWRPINVVTITAIAPRSAIDTRLKLKVSKANIHPAPTRISERRNVLTAKRSRPITHTFLALYTVRTDCVAQSLYYFFPVSKRFSVGGRGN
jgi:hypothetical protein